MCQATFFATTFGKTQTDGGEEKNLNCLTILESRATRWKKLIYDHVSHECDMNVIEQVVKNIEQVENDKSQSRQSEKGGFKGCDDIVKIT